MIPDYRDRVLYGRGPDREKKEEEEDYSKGSRTVRHFVFFSRIVIVLYRLF